jgi:hypothetical protein
MLLANLVLLFWKKDFPRRTEKVISPWTPEFREFLIVSTAYVVGSNLFGQGDLLVANKFFPKGEIDAYGSASLLARSLPVVSGPLLTVLFTHRSGSHHHHGDDLREQLKLLGLFAFGLVFGAACLFVLKDFALHVLGRNTPQAAGMIAPLSVTMIFVGLLQAIGTWALASRWQKISLLYGGLGVGYWLALLTFGRSPAALLQTMPVVAGIAFAILFCLWFIMMRRHKPAAQS